ANVPVDIFAKAPGQRATVVHAGFGDIVRTLDGRAGWVASADKPLPLMQLTGGNLDGAKVEAMVAFPMQIRQAFRQWRVTSSAIDDKEVEVLQGRNPRSRRQRRRQNYSDPHAICSESYE